MSDWLCGQLKEKSGSINASHSWLHVVGLELLAGSESQAGIPNKQRSGLSHSYKCAVCHFELPSVCVCVLVAVSECGRARVWISVSACERV